MLSFARPVRLARSPRSSCLPGCGAIGRSSKFASPVVSKALPKMLRNCVRVGHILLARMSRKPLSTISNSCERHVIALPLVSVANRTVSAFRSARPTIPARTLPRHLGLVLPDGIDRQLVNQLRFHERGRGRVRHHPRGRPAPRPLNHLPNPPTSSSRARDRDDGGGRGTLRYADRQRGSGRTRGILRSRDS